MSESSRWLRWFVKHHRFSSEDDLMDACREDRSTQIFVQYMLDLQYKAARRKTVADVMAANAMQSRPRWLLDVRARLWHHYESLCTLVSRPQGSETDPSVFWNLSLTQRRIASRSFTVTSIRRNISSMVHRTLKLMRRTIGQNLAVCWMDNYSTFRYSRNPNAVRDQSLNCTVFALLPTTTAMLNWSGMKDLQALVFSLRPTAHLLNTAAISLSNSVRSLLQQNPGYEDLRVPLDYRRIEVRSAPWFPADLQPHAVSTTTGLCSALLHVKRNVSLTPAVMPILADVNSFFYRIVKACYAASHCHLNLCYSLHFHPPIFAVWHAYVHCLRRVHQLFLPLWSALEYPALMAGGLQALQVKVYSYPKVVTLEHMALGLFLAARLPGLMTEVQRTLQFADRHFPDEHWRSLAESLRMLLDEYIPAVLHLVFWCVSSTGSTPRRTRATMPRSSCCSVCACYMLWSRLPAQNTFVGCPVLFCFGPMNCTLFCLDGPLWKSPWRPHCPCCPAEFRSLFPTLLQISTGSCTSHRDLRTRLPGTC